MENKRKNFIRTFNKRYIESNTNAKQFNLYLFLAILTIGIAGLFILFSASSYLTIKFNLDKFYYAKRHLIFLVIGITLMLVISKINYRFYYDYAKIIYIIAIILLILVYVPFFQVLTNGTRRSIKLLITFMPSDVAKLALIIYLAKYLTLNIKKMKYLYEGLILVAIIILIPFTLILFQTDLSTSIVILLSSGILYLVSGFKSKFTPLLIVLGIIFSFMMIILLKDYQIDRLIAFTNPEKYYNDLSWQVLNGLFAVSRGGLSGQGYGKSIYKHGYLANEVNNDMIFAVIGEEFGFIGSVLFLTLVFTITYLTLKIAIKSKDEFAKRLCIGIALVYVIQSMINIGVSLSVIPNTGITLPFVSNGGTSLVVYCIMFGIVLNISRYNIKKTRKNNKLK